MKTSNETNQRIFRPAASRSLDRVVMRVWFTMVLLPGKGWTRVGKAYGSKKAARGWLGFVSKAWHGLRVRVSQSTLRWRNGEMTDRSKKTLSAKYNMEPPTTNAAISDLQKETSTKGEK